MEEKGKRARLGIRRREEACWEECARAAGTASREGVAPGVVRHGREERFRDPVLRRLHLHLREQCAVLPSSQAKGGEGHGFLATGVATSIRRGPAVEGGITPVEIGAGGRRGGCVRTRGEETATLRKWGLGCWANKFIGSGVVFVGPTNLGSVVGALLELNFCPETPYLTIGAQVGALLELL